MWRLACCADVRAPLPPQGGQRRGTGGGDCQATAQGSKCGHCQEVWDAGDLQAVLPP